MNLISTDNVVILCLSCNVKKSKTTAKLSENSRNSLRSNNFSSMSSVRSALILLPLLTVALH